MTLLHEPDYGTPASTSLDSSDVVVDGIPVSVPVGTSVRRANVTDRVAPGVVYTTFHFPDSRAHVITTEYFEWVTNCTEHKVTDVEVTPTLRWPEASTVAAGAKAQSPGARRHEQRIPPTPVPLRQLVGILGAQDPVSR